MSVEEYLNTSFDGADCEYLDGEIVERNPGELPHGRLQASLGYWLLQLGLPIQVLAAIRIPISPTRYRVADIAVWRPGNIGTHIPTVAPFLVVEILSREDRIVRMQTNLREYLSIGVEHIWLIDPREGKALAYSQLNPAGELTEVLETPEPAIRIPLGAVLAPLAES